MLDQIMAKLETISQDIAEIKVQDAIQNEQLKEHMRRSDLLELRVEQVNKELKPLHNHLNVVHGLVKLIGFLGTILAIILAIKGILK